MALRCGRPLGVGFFAVSPQWLPSLPPTPPAAGSCRRAKALRARDALALEHLEPTLLLGFTATPEPAYGDDILHWFGGRIATKLPLWSTLDEGLICPCYYFCLHEGTNLSR